MIDQLKQQVADSLPRFEETAGKVPWAPRSILKSEGLAVCAMADLYGIDLLIESGICNGRSTEMWCRYFGDSLEAHTFDIYAIDWELKSDVRKRLQRHRIQLCRGDVHNFVHELMGQSLRRIGVFIDGPKDQAAVDLAIKCMSYEAVQFVGVHDAPLLSTSKRGRLGSTRAELELPGHRYSWATDADWFVDLAYRLDIGESHIDTEQGTKWTPYCRNEIHKPPVPLGSYGYTVAFLAKELP